MPIKKTPRAAKIIEHKKVDKTQECWEWTGRRDHFGYGQVKYKGKVCKAHRLAYLQNKGPIPKGQCVLHACDNPPCLNPAHLSIGTHLQNNLDAVARNRNFNTRKKFCLKGHPFNKKNTYIHGPKGRWRACRECCKLKMRKLRAAKRGV